jgi:hypothetical protein
VPSTTPAPSGGQQGQAPATPDYSFGQWVGWSREEGGLETRVTVNFEKRTPGIAQILTYVPQNPGWRVSTVALIQDSQDTMVIDSPDVRMFDLQTGQLVPLGDFMAGRKIEEPLPKRTTYKISERGRVVSGAWENDLGRKGTFSIVNTTDDLLQNHPSRLCVNLATHSFDPDQGTLRDSVAKQAIEAALDSKLRDPKLDHMV